MRRWQWIGLIGAWLSIAPVAMLGALLCGCPSLSCSADVADETRPCCPDAVPLPSSGCSASGDCSPLCDHCSVSYLQAAPVWVNRVFFEPDAVSFCPVPLFRLALDRSWSWLL